VEQLAPLLFRQLKIEMIGCWVRYLIREPGDHFLGRFLAGLDPNKSEFATLPQHFKKEGNVMGDLDIKDAMDMMYHPILDTYNREADLTGLLLFVLASRIYHSVWLKTIVAQRLGHPFSLIPFLNSLELIKKLQAKMDLKEGDQGASGISKRCGITGVRRKGFRKWNDHWRAPKKVFEDYHGEVLKAISSRMTLLSQATSQDTQNSDITESEDMFADSLTKEVSETAAKKKTHRLYTYEGRIWHVPKNFIFPTNAKLLTG